MGLSEIDRSFARLGEQSCRPSTPAGNLPVPEKTSPAALPKGGLLCHDSLEVSELAPISALHCTTHVGQPGRVNETLKGSKSLLVHLEMDDAQLHCQLSGIEDIIVQRRQV